MRRAQTVVSLISPVLFFFSSGPETASILAPGETGALTAREYEVAELMGRGLTNREIAETRYIAQGSAKNHAAWPAYD